MHALRLGLLLLLASATGGCMGAACIQYGAEPQDDLCVNDVARLYCDDSEDGSDGCGEDDLPIRCDDYRLATACDDEGFDVDCGGIWIRKGGTCD